MYDRDDTDGRCELCGTYCPTRSYITRTWTPPAYREDFDPPKVTRGRQCYRCFQGRCQATLYHVSARCERITTSDSAICDECSETVKNVMNRTLQVQGIELG